MGKKLFSLCMALVLCLSLLPATALAAAPNGQVIYVGNENVTNGGYWTTDSAGTVTAFTGEGTPADNFIYYDASRNTLTLHNATIRMSVSIDTNTLLAGAAIGVLNQYGDGNAELTITLEGTNTIAEVGKGIYVLASSTGGATLTITGDGSLDASASQTGIWVQSNSGNATLTIRNAKVEATGTSRGVNVQSHASSTASLTVDGGSLTASGSPGILYDSIGSGTVPNTTALTIRNSAIVDARGGGIGAGYIWNLSGVSPTDDSVGIVFGLDLSDSSAGTVYGDVTLQDDLEIGEGESLTIPDGSSLTIPNDKTLTVNGGALTGGVTGTVIYKVTGVSLNMTELTLTEGGSETLTASIAPTDATNQKVTWNSSAPAVATVDVNGKVTAVDAGTAVITVTTEDGNKTVTCTVTVEHDPAGAWSSDADGHWHACAACGDRLDYAGHTRTVENEKKATCTEEGYTGDTVCSVCGYVIEKGETIPAAGHSWGAWAATEPATCEKDGLETRACEACGEEEIRSVPALGHDFENGTCAVCGAKDEGYVAPEEPKDPEQTPEPSDPEPTVPETGDATASFSLALGVLGAAALGAGAIARRRG